MYDHDIEAKIRAGGWMVTLGILLLVGGLFGSCIMGAKNAGYSNSTERSFEDGQNPFLLLSIAGAIALITIGAVKKSNARREGEERFKKEHFTTTKTVVDPDVEGGPFRGATKHVEVLDPVMAEIERAQKEADHKRGTTNLIIGGVLMGGTVIAILMAVTSDSGGLRQQLDRVLMSIGLGFFPFGFGLFFAIRGLLLRSK